MKSSVRVLFSCAVLALAGATGAVRAADPVTDVRLYAMECGTARFKDFGAFSDTGEYDGKAHSAGVSCYLIRHPKGSLLWDAGLGDALSAAPGGVDAAGGAIHLQVDKPLLPQLLQIGITPDDVTHLAFSHLHFDHTGNANAFAQATWLMNKAELDAALVEPPPFGVDPSTFSAHKTAKLDLLAGDRDVFGDGSVRILSTPGHTPGHQVLMIQLAKAGTVILSGDLYHTQANRKNGRVPVINTSRAETLASFDRVEKIVKNRKARFVIQHAPEDFAALPKFPAYLN